MRKGDGAMKRLGLGFVLLLLIAGSTAVQAATTPQAAVPTGAVEAVMVSVTDGDTIKVNLDGQTQTVRLIGIDTPEVVDPQQPVQCFGPEASKRTKAAVPPGRHVWLEKDVSETDRYGRLLRYVWIVSPRDHQAYLINEILVDEGYAVSSTYPPDVKYQDRFLKDQQEARDAGRGLWSACPGGEATSQPVSPPTPAPVPQQAQGGNCDPSYPTVCIPPPPPDLDCGQISYRRFEVLPPDPHRFDADHDGIGCESG